MDSSSIPFCNNRKENRNKMNKNKKVIKTMSSVLCASMLMGSVTPVFAATTDTQTTSKETDSKSVEVTYDKSASYFVTIPKTIVLDSNKESTYSVKVEGDIPSDKNVYVAPVDAISQTNEIDFYMKDQSTKNIKADVVATVTHNKDTWDFEDASSGYEETNNSISALGLSSGEWKGTFNFNINLRDVANSGDDKKDDANYGEDVTLTRNNLSTYGISTKGNVEIPKYVTDSDGTKHKVVGLGNNIFNNCKGLTSITIPDSVTNIGEYAFGLCSSLTSITIPNSVTSIELGTFNDSGLTSITIPNSVTSIGDNAFSRCNNLVSITIPDSVTSIEYAAFYSCTSLTSITIPDSITSIGNSAFDSCKSLASVTYKGQTYTSRLALKTALTNNNVTLVGANTFSSTALTY